MIRPLEEDIIIQHSIASLVNFIEKSGHNPKLVILHSIRVGTYLYNNNYSKDIVIAGYLHDVIEDSDTNIKEIQKLYGKNVALLVKANSFDKVIIDKIESYKDIYKRLIEAGKDALIIKAADILDNLPYYKISENGNDYGENKINSFLRIAKPYIGNEIAYQKLENKFKEEQNNKH